MNLETPLPSALPILGTPLEVTNYAAFIARCRNLLSQERTFAVEFSNTQIVTMRRHDSCFREMTNCFDFFIPDGMPLIWCLNWRGANLKDRVYGPTFMRECISATHAPFNHYLLGGSEECGEKLLRAIKEWNPDIKIVGAYHGHCALDGKLEGDFERSVIAEINDLSPDFIWLGVGTPKQQAWIHRNKTLIRRGLLMSVGFAFDVNAGTKKDAPLWMQRLGLTWVYRLCSEPRRLLFRYLRYNSLFLFYLLHNSLSRKKCSEWGNKS